MSMSIQYVFYETKLGIGYTSSVLSRCSIFKLQKLININKDWHGNTCFGY